MKIAIRQPLRIMDIVDYLHTNGCEPSGLRRTKNRATVKGQFGRPRLTLTILLQYEDRGTFVAVGIILNHNRFGNAESCVSYKNIIGSQFIVAMARYENLTSTNELKNPL